MGALKVGLHASLTLALDGGEWLASHPDCFTPRARAPSTNWIGGWEGAQSQSECGGNKKKNLPLPEIEHHSSSL